MLNKIIRKIIELSTRNIIVNNIAVILRFDNRFKSIGGYWRNFSYDSSKTSQENVGFSHLPDVEEALRKTHSDLVSAARMYLSPGDAILDIGCGTGLYLKDFENEEYELFGIDMSAQMIAAAKKELPRAHFVVGDFMKQDFTRKFGLIYLISVLEYISRTDLDSFFRKLYDLLAENGIVFIHYPHALSFYESLYPDLNYIKYSPPTVQRIAEKYFDILSHKHGFDDREVGRFDVKPYPSERGSFKNGYLLIARKKRSI